MPQEDPLGGLVALGRAPRGTSFADLIAESKQHLGRLVPATSVNAQWLTPAHLPRGLYFHQLRPEDFESYVLEHWKTDPMTPKGLLRDGEALTLASAAPRKVIERTPYWNDLVIPMRITQVLGVSCTLPAGDTLQIACHRRKGETRFTDAELRRWTVAGGEVTRAVAALAFRERGTEAESGVLLFDRHAQLVHADEGGGALFARLIEHGRGPWLASLAREVATLTPGGRDRHASVPYGDGAELHLRLSVSHGLAPGATVVIGLSVESDPSERVRVAARRAGLSPREAAVAALVARGLTNREIGAVLGVRAVTARDHLRRAFAALGVSSRTELVTKLLGR